MNTKERNKYDKMKAKSEQMEHDFPTSKLNKLFAKSLAKQVAKKLQKMEGENEGCVIRKGKDGLPIVKGRLADDSLNPVIVVKGYEKNFCLEADFGAVRYWLGGDESAYKSLNQYDKAVLKKETGLKALLREVKEDAMKHRMEEASKDGKTEEYLKGCVEANEWCGKYADDPDFMDRVVSCYKTNLDSVGDDYSETDAKDDAIREAMEAFGIEEGEEDLER